MVRRVGLRVVSPPGGSGDLENRAEAGSGSACVRTAWRSRTEQHCAAGCAHSFANLM